MNTIVEQTNTLDSNVRGLISSIYLSPETLHHVSRNDVYNYARCAIKDPMLELYLKTDTILLVDFVLRSTARILLNKLVPLVSMRPTVTMGLPGLMLSEDIKTYGRIDSTPIHIDTYASYNTSNVSRRLPCLELNVPQPITYLDSQGNGIKVIGIGPNSAIVILITGMLTLGYYYNNDGNNSKLELMHQPCVYDEFFLSVYNDRTFNYIALLNKYNERTYNISDGQLVNHIYSCMHNTVMPHDRCEHMRADKFGIKSIYVQGSRVNGGSINAPHAIVYRR